MLAVTGNQHCLLSLLRTALSLAVAVESSCDWEPTLSVNTPAGCSELGSGGGGDWYESLFAATHALSVAQTTIRNWATGMEAFTATNILFVA